jgi:aminopeptidase-like protein
MADTENMVSALMRGVTVPSTFEGLGSSLYELIGKMYPFCRSLTGNGNRETLKIVDSVLPLEIHEVPTGTTAYDWTVPNEWNIRDAYVKNKNGKRVIDFRDSNLHVVSYSTPIHRWMQRSELLEHLHSDSDHPNWIPFRNTYYRENWGFCIKHSDLEQLRDDQYEVCIDSTLAPGSLTYGEALIAGEKDDEVLISTHICHPSLCNDNLSGIAIAAYLGKLLQSIRRRYSYRIVFLPCTIGPIVWLSRNESRLPHIKHGLVLSCLGDSGSSTYVCSRSGDAEVDRAAAHVLRHSGSPHTIRQFEPYGYDQRQYCSPAFNLPIGCLMRTPDGGFPEYHTSADNLELMSPQALADSLMKIMATLLVLEKNHRYENLSPWGEPQLGKHGLYHRAKELGLMWTLSFSDRESSLLDIAERSSMPFHVLQQGVEELRKARLLAPVPDSATTR